MYFSDKQAVGLLSEMKTQGEKDAEIVHLKPIFFEDRAYGTWQLLTSAENFLSSAKEDLASYRSQVVFGLCKLVTCVAKVKDIALPS